MVHSRNTTNRINRLNESSLPSLVNDDSKNVSFRELLLKNKSVSTQQINFTYLQWKF